MDTVVGVTADVSIDIFSWVLRNSKNVLQMGSFNVWYKVLLLLASQSTLKQEQDIVNLCSSTYSQKLSKIQKE